MKNEAILSSGVARTLAKSTRLCARCLRREGVPSLLLRRSAVNDSECEVCAGLLANVSHVAGIITEKLKEYQFESFVIGTSLPQRILDKEDEIRARFKIRGREGIKTEITRSFSSEVSKNTKKRLSYLRPDLTLLVSLPDGEISITPRSIWLFAKYHKTIRGIAQRSSLCQICNGIGCAACEYRGASLLSVQYLVNNFLSEKYRAEGCSFIWVGSEDERSLVDGNGRPFYVEVLKPKRRTPIRRLKTAKLNGVRLSSIEVLPSRPTLIPQFTMRCFAYLVQPPQREGDIPSKVMKDEIESKFKDLSVRVRLSRRFRVVTKRIQSILVQESKEDHRVVLDINCDGGIPIKKFVSGEDESVSPNLAPFIGGLELDPQMPFDIANVTLADSKKRLISRSKLKHYRDADRKEPPERETSQADNLEAVAENTI